MKAVVVQIKGRHAALLQDNGVIVKKKNENYSIGDEIIMKHFSISKKLRVAVAAAMFFMIATVGVAAYSTPYYYVSLDVNPGILMKVNLFERVIGVESTNEDAADVIKDLDLKNKGIETALCNAIDKINEKGYFSKNDNIIIAASSKNNEKADKLADGLKLKIIDEISDEEINADLECKGIGYEMVQKAREWNITPGKYNIITHLLDEEVTEANSNQSIKELMSRYHVLKNNKEQNENKEQNKNRENSQIKNENQEQEKIENRMENGTEQKYNQNNNAAPVSNEKKNRK